MKLDFLLTVDTEAGTFEVVNQSTGESKTVDIPKATTKKSTTTRKKKADESSDPQIILEDNKLVLNTAAVELTGVEPDGKVCVKMRKINKVMTPIFGTIEAFKVTTGNRVTKSFTVAFRGSQNEALISYGTVFTLEENPDGSGTFIMHGDKAPADAPADENIDDDVELPAGLSADLDALEDDIPSDAEEVDGSDFEAMLAGID